MTGVNVRTILSRSSRNVLFAFVLIGMLLFTAALPAHAFSQAFFHTQSVGNRGVDVQAIQYLLRQRGFNVSADGIFGSGTDSAVRSFQSQNGLAVDGIVGPGTWGALVVTLRSGSTGEAVKALQIELNAKRNAGLTVDGVFGGGTDSAVRSFQSHAGLGVDGIAGATTWRNLIWHYDTPNFGLAAVCDYDGGNGTAGNWGTGAAVGQIEAAANQFYGTGNGPVAIGDIGLEHGGDIVGHASHEVGLDIDIRPIRLDSGQCSSGCQWNQSCYDRAATRALVQSIRNTAPGHVRLIFFNDPTLINEGLTTYYDNHDNHLHVRYCEKVHPNSLYTC